MIQPPRYGNTIRLSAPNNGKGPIIDLTTHCGPGGMEAPHCVNVTATQITPSRNCLPVARVSWGDGTFKDEIEVDPFRGCLVGVPSGRVSVDAFLEPPGNLSGPPIDEYEFSARVWQSTDRSRGVTRTRNLGVMPTNQTLTIPVPRYAVSLDVLIDTGAMNNITLTLQGDSASLIGRSTAGTLVLPGLGANLLVQNTGVAKNVMLVFKLAL